MVKWEHIFYVALGFCLGVGVMALSNRTHPAPIMITPPEPTPLPTPEPTAGLMSVYVSGAVANTAVYQLPPGSIVEQAIEAAGGFANTADKNAINLAQSLTDGMQIYVPSQGETIMEEMVISAEANTTNNTSTNDLININTATAEELDVLPGIGPGTAQNIIEYRQANGPFAAIENIMDVPGIGEGKFNDLKDLITVGEGTQ